MHEAAIAANIIESATRQAKQNKAFKIDRINLEIGTLAGIEHHALLFALKSFRDNSLFYNTIFNINKIQAMGHCTNCCKTVVLEIYESYCPYCHEFSVEIIRGNELIIQSIDLTID
jgi:hydrogenase nickel incorporation protein HypA/HybF